MAVVRIRIVAENDPSLKKTVLDYVALVTRADKAIENSSKASSARRTKAVQGGYRESALEEQKLTATVAREEKKRTTEHERALKHVAGVRDRHFASAQRQEERDANKSIVRAQRVGREAVSTVRRVAKQAIGLSLGGAGAIGIDTSMTSIVGKGVDLERKTIDIANAGSKTGAATDGDVTKTKAGIASSADATKTDVNKMADALGAFVTVTGELDTGLASLTKMGVLARATGSDIVDLATAQAMVSKSLGDIPDKANVLDEIMRSIAEQGRKGSVEIKQLAQYMPRLSSKAFLFSGSRAHNMMTLGGMAQVATEGGATDAAEATTSASNFALDTAKGADKIKETTGIDVFADATRTKLKDASSIIPELLKKTGGDLSVMGDLFNKQSLKTVLGFQAIYDAAGGGEAGIEAVRTKLKSFEDTISPEAVTEGFKRSANSIEAKAVDFNNKMQATVTKAVETLMPAFEKLMPVALQAAESLASLAPAVAEVVSWIAQNPLQAAGLALVASVAEAGIGAAVRDALTNAIKGGGGPGGAPNPISGGLTVIATGAVAFTATTVFLKAMEKQEEKSSNRVASGEMDMFATINRIKNGETDAVKLLDEQIKTGEDALQQHGAGLRRLDNPEEYRRNLDEAKDVSRQAWQRRMDEVIYKPQSKPYARPGQDWDGSPVEYHRERPGQGPNGEPLEYRPEKKDGGGGEAMKTAADAHTQAALALSNAATQLANAANAVGAPKEGTTRA